jgi:hypothetical protein
MIKIIKINFKFLKNFGNRLLVGVEFKLGNRVNVKHPNNLYLTRP